jgi:glycosyltransferase involved in cell wall biosynthesis
LKVLMITPKVDPEDDLLGFAHTWVSRLARRVERLYVLQLLPGPATGRGDRGEIALPANTSLHSMGTDGRASKAEQLLRFTRLVGSLCLGRRVDAVLAHMGPIFAVCAAPFARAAGVPLVLWYAHGAVSPTLRVAHALVDRVGTSSPAGFRLRSRKVRYTGQGIDTDRFTPPAVEPADAPLVSIGRISPVKDYETLLHALARLHGRGLRLRLEIVGGVRRASEVRYLESLRSLSAELGLDGPVAFRPGVPHRVVASLYQRSALFVSASRTGSLDKAVLEALACGRVAITCNEAFAEFFGADAARYTFPTGDPETLSERLEWALCRKPEDRRELGLALRRRVVAEHSVEHLTDELVALLGPKC